MILDEITYSNIKNILESSDKENMIVGFECIENTDFKTNIIYILFLFKEADISSDMWKRNAPKATEIIENLFNIPFNKININYAQICDIITKFNVTWASYQFLMNRYAEHLKKYFNRDISQIETLTITITPAK